jgi:hypothetical protein
VRDGVMASDRIEDGGQSDHLRLGIAQRLGAWRAATSKRFPFMSISQQPGKDGR